MSFDMLRSDAPKLFHYSHYRTFLSEWLKYQQEKKNLSLEYFSRKFGFQSRGHLHNLLSGKRPLSLAAANKIAGALKLSAKEIRYLEELVLFERSKSQPEKEKHLIRITKMRFANRHILSYETLKRNPEYHLYWYYPIIREMVRLDHFSSDPKWISKKLRDRITPTVAKRALEKLCEWNYVNCGEDGKYTVAEEKCFVGDQHENIALKSFYREMLVRGSEALEHPRDSRAFGSMTTVISKKKASEAQALIRQFVEKFDSLLSDTQAPQPADTEVYHLQVGFFSLTQEPVPTEKTKGEENE